MIRIKTREQIDGIRKSCGFLKNLFNILEREIVPGITTAQLDDCARRYIHDIGGKPAFLGYMGFPNTLCTSVNSVVIHGIPDKTVLRDGDIISVDCGIIFQGFYSDYAYTFPVGTVSPDIKKLLRITEDSLYRGIEAAIVGNRINDISTSIYRRIKPEKYGVVREFSGHGVGLELHESPSIPNFPTSGANPRIRPGFVLAIEPMINLGGDEVYVHADDWTVETSDGSVSAHFEHTIVIHNSETEILTLRN